MSNLKYKLIILSILIITIQTQNIFDIVSQIDQSSNQIEDVVDKIETLAGDATSSNDFISSIANLVSIEPDYYNYTPFKDNYKFECETNLNLDSTETTSVHKLRPSDIKVIAALGDSITAAMGSGAKDVLGLMYEYRGRSWSIGGDGQLETVVTLPNILKKFNPNLTGFSTGSNIVFLMNKGQGLNFAVSGQEANHMLNQAKKLILNMKLLKNINFEKDWKVITLFVGGNDLCRFCFNKQKHSPQSYINDIQKALDLLYKEVPRAFVNLVPILDVAQIKDVSQSKICKSLHVIECKCGAYASPNEEKTLREYIAQYQNYTKILALSDRYDGRDDFTVVGQPFLVNFKIPKLPNGKIDFSFTAPDCFHFSSKGHTAAAIGLWNNMLQPVGKKTETMNPNDQILCPTVQMPFFYTNKNSK